MAFPTYVGNRECLLDYCTTITPSETPMFTRWGKAAVTNQYVEWQTDTLRVAADNKKYPTQTYVQDTIVTTTLQHTYTQILTAGYAVSESQIAANPAGRGDELSYQKAKALKEIGIDIEYMIVNHTSEVAPASATTAGESKGIGGYVTGNYVSGDAMVASVSGALTKAVLDAQLAVAWANGAVEMNAIYTSAKQKMVINAFPGTIRKMDETADKLAGLVNIYESEFGTLECIKDRRLADTVLWATTDDYWKIGMFRPMVSKVLPQTADAQAFVLVTELACICMAPSANTGLSGLS